MSNVLRNIPSVNELLESPPLRRLANFANRTTVVSGVRHFLDNLRQEVQNAAAEVDLPTPTELAERIARWIAAEETPNLRPVINATGILLHTGLGRAPMASAALDALVDVARGYASVEVDVASGQRSQRVADVERILKRLTGAEAAAVVNNNAGATLLTLAALASGREVIVSRGQLVEIGGSYRLPEVMEFSGARLREVGTTNKTRAEDYRAAIGPQTAALMRVHTSNFAIVGFTEQTSLADLVELGRRHEVAVIDDIGSGALHDFGVYGVEGEPMVGESLRAGADVVLFSGDKLLGGPQCGIILGRKQYIDSIRRHPLMRALRVDKLTLTALFETLRLHQSRERAEQAIPLLELLSTPAANLQNRAERLAPQMAACSAIAAAEAIAATTYLGGGSVPMQEIVTWCIALRPASGSLDGLAKALRNGTPSVFGRIQKDRLLLDLRSVFPRQDLELVEAVRRLGTAAPETDSAEPPVSDSPGDHIVEG
ncbi:MAG: L-seryl-tRNA(Sec) selenium transferase [Pirellulaceae bacterium]|nr:L-seryl-tRNA(Sec) selenium transferase [Pirellulaceae bacterium]